METSVELKGTVYTACVVIVMFAIIALISNERNKK